MAALAMKVWASDETKPVEGKVSNLGSYVPPNWFLEAPEYAAELYGLERGPGTYTVYVEDTRGGQHEFTVAVEHKLHAEVQRKC